MTEREKEIPTKEITTAGDDDVSHYERGYTQGDYYRDYYERD